ncbi:hypothetical protein D3C71_1907180 [compost metagenome]
MYTVFSDEMSTPNSIVGEQNNTGSHSRGVPFLFRHSVRSFSVKRNLASRSIRSSCST